VMAAIRGFMGRAKNLESNSSPSLRASLQPRKNFCKSILPSGLYLNR